MSKFIQLHILASYPPSNLNRDDLGRPKTAVMGGSQRLRVSSQSLKRAWRTSDIFKEALSGHIGIRTRDMGIQIHKALTTGHSLSDLIEGKINPSEKNDKVSEEKARKWAQSIAGVFGKLKTAKSDDEPEEKSKKEPDDLQMESSSQLNLEEMTNTGDSEKTKKGKSKKGKPKKEPNTLQLEQLVHFSPEEITAIDLLITKLVQSNEDPSDKDLKLLRETHTAVDIAMFGRMLASSPAYSTEAAVQVSHAITVHSVTVEDDYFTAVDDLNSKEEAMGSGHIGEAEFASGLFYTYICVNCDLLEKNLDGNGDLAQKALKALVESAAKVSPTGKQNSFASRAYASYILAEKGTQQPRSLSVSFLKALNSKDLLGEAINVLKDTSGKMEEVYGKCSDDKYEMNAYNAEGKLSKVMEFVADYKGGSV